MSKKKDIKVTSDELTQLIQGFALHGVRAERERIIKLLDNYCDGNHSMFDQCSCAMRIALIKGENK